jgi:light-regulated signal transduction histidine kinase (bacteriophytochrome)
MTPDTLELLREVGHRLRTPLATVHGYASLLEAHIQDPRVEPADLALWAHRIQLETDRLNSLLVDLSRLRAAVAGTTRPTSLDLRGVVHDAVRQAETELDQTLPFDTGAPLPYAGDATLLNRLAYHLAVLGLQRRQGASLRLTPDARGACLELRLPSGWTPPPHDVWLFFCESVAEAHAGRVEHRPEGPAVYLA